MTRQELHEAALSLPVEERALLVDLLLRSLTPHDPEIAREWADVAVRRLEEIESGRVAVIRGEEIIAEIRHRFGS